MAATSMVLEDESALSKIDRVLHRIEGWLALGGGLTIFGLMVITSTNIISRKLFNLPVPGFVDWVEQVMIIVAFWGLAYCHRLGGHIRMDILVSQFTGRLLWVTEFLTTLVIFFVVAVLTWGTFQHFQRAYEIGDSSMDILLPLWPAKLVVPIAFGFLALRLAVHVWAYGRAIVTGEEKPVAVPMIETVEEQAANEAATVSGAPQDDLEPGETR